MPDTSVKYFDSSMSGAPRLAAYAGDLIAFLDAVLINGFGEVSVSSISVSSGVATVTTAEAHGFSMIGATGPVVAIAGVTNITELNGEQRLATVPDTTSFTFSTEASDGSASGTMTVKRAPVGGWEKAYSGTNTAAYRSIATGASGCYLRVNDAATSTAILSGYRTMSDVDTGTYVFPSTGEVHSYRYTSTTGRTWAFIADPSAMFLLNNSTGTMTFGFCFGDFVPYDSSDAYPCMLVGSPWAGGNTLSLVQYGTPALAKSIGSANVAMGYTTSTKRCSDNQLFGSSGEAYPAKAGGGLALWPIEVWETTDVCSRGRLVGPWCPVTVFSSGSTGDDYYENLQGLSGRTVKMVQFGTQTYYKVAFDITGPWR